MNKVQERQKWSRGRRWKAAARAAGSGYKQGQDAIKARGHFGPEVLIKLFRLARKLVKYFTTYLVLETIIRNQIKSRPVCFITNKQDGTVVPQN